MIQKERDMQSPRDAPLQTIRRYVIKEVGMGQHETVCKKIVYFSLELDFSTYYQGLKADYDGFYMAYY